MRHAWLVMGALLLLGPALRGADQPGAAPARENPVLVDPLDLRTPIPEPEAGLTEKYDGKLVRYTGQVTASGQDARKSPRILDALPGARREKRHHRVCCVAKSVTRPELQLSMGSR